MHDLHATFNCFEAALWFLIAAVLAARIVQAAWTSRPWPWLETTLGVAFATFGTSDLIEVSTGAWWRPWWLLVMKGACVLTFLAGYIAYRRRSEAPR